MIHIEYDFVPDPSWKHKGRSSQRCCRKVQEKSGEASESRQASQEGHLIQIKRRCAYSSSLANARREIVVNSDIARKHNESSWPLDSQVPVLILRIRSILYAGNSQREVLVALAAGVSCLTMLPFLQGSQIPTAGVPPRKQHQRGLHVELLMGLLVAELRRKIPKASDDISHPSRAQSLKSWKSMLNLQLNPVRHRKRKNLSLSPMTAYPLHVNKNLLHQANESQAARPTIHLTYGPLTTSLVFLNATVLKTKVDPVLDVIKGRIIVDTGSGVHIVGRSNVHKKAL